MKDPTQIARGIAKKLSNGFQTEDWMTEIIATTLREYYQAREEVWKSNTDLVIKQADAEGYRRGVEWCVSVFENGTGGEGTTELQDATLLHYARKLQRGTGGGE